MTPSGSALKNPYAGSWTSAYTAGDADQTVAWNATFGVFYGVRIAESLTNDLVVFRVDPAVGPEMQNPMVVVENSDADRTDIASGTARGFGEDPQDPLYTAAGENLVYLIYGPLGVSGETSMRFTRARNGGAQPEDWLSESLVVTPGIVSAVPRLAVDGDGILHVAHTDWNGAVGHSYSVSDGTQWTTDDTGATRNDSAINHNGRVDGSFNVYVTTMIAVDRRAGMSGVYVTYHDADDEHPTDLDVFLVPGERDPATGEVAWGPKVNLSDAFEEPGGIQVDQFFPMLYVGDRGYLHLVWTEADDPDPQNESINPVVRIVHVYWSRPTVNPYCPGGVARGRTVINDELETGSGTFEQTQIGEYMGLDGRGNHILAVFPSTRNNGWLNRRIYSCDIFFSTGDLDGDGSVDLNDFATFSLCFNSQSCDCATSDLNDDDLVDLNDFATFAVEFTGSLGCPTGGGDQQGSPAGGDGDTWPLDLAGLASLAEWSRTVLPEQSWHDLAAACLEVAAEEADSPRGVLHATFAELLLDDPPQ
ncbi:MAG: hypothetical protein JSU68_09840 [Phycisphaerales bacterium]|nr:MAG: hypothetical protein JSU68_09840 [Phycisphaerales bacterium]